MKTLVLSALLGASLTTASANTNSSATVIETVAKDKKTEELKSQIALLQWKIDVVWDQYYRAVENIKDKRGGVADLMSQMNNLIRYYHDDIDQGLRVSDSKRAIAEIREMYGKKIEKQRKAEAKEIARMQALLQGELRQEEIGFIKLKRTHAAQIDAQTKPLVQATELQFAQSAARMEALKGASAWAAL